MDEPSFISAMFGNIGLWLYWGGWALTAIIAAYYIYQDSLKLKRHALNIPSGVWVVFALVVGFWAILPYWLMERSSLARHNEGPP